MPQHGTYQLKVTSLLFEEASDVQSQLVILGQVYGVAGTDYWRRDLIVPLLWGMPLSLMIGFLGTFITTLIAMLLPAIGVWFGGWLDTAIQRLTEINMVLPGLAIASIVYALHGVNIWIILAVVVVLNALGAPIKSFRSAFLQAKEAPYIEMARSYGASDFRIITRYLVPRILPVLIPYLVMQIPTFIFLEATLGFFRIRRIQVKKNVTGNFLVIVIKLVRDRFLHPAILECFRGHRHIPALLVHDQPGEIRREAEEVDPGGCSNPWYKIAATYPVLVVVHANLFIGQSYERVERACNEKYDDRQAKNGHRIQPKLVHEKADPSPDLPRGIAQIAQNSIELK